MKKTNLKIEGSGSGDPKFMTHKQLAERWGISDKQLRYMMQDRNGEYHVDNSYYDEEEDV